MTAVEWLINELQLYYEGKSKLVYYEIIAQAKEMEKQEIEEAHKKGQHYSDRFEVPHQIAAEEYYINNFKSE